MNRQEKEQMVGELLGTFKASDFAVLVNYQGSTCEELTSLRKKLKPVGGKFAVVKNTLARRALQDSDLPAAGVESLKGLFAGPTAVIWSETDPVSPAKIIRDFAKDNEKFSVKAGILGEQILDAKQVESLAAMPSRDELLGKLLALINAPATRLLQTINAPAAQIARLMEAWRGELEKKQ